MERTLSIIKPDGVARGLIGDVIRRFEENDLKIIAMKMIHMDKAQAEGFYAVHLGKPFFDSLTDFMSSGPAVVMILEGLEAIGLSVRPGPDRVAEIYVDAATKEQAVKSAGRIRAWSTLPPQSIKAPWDAVLKSAKVEVDGPRVLVRVDVSSLAPPR